MRPSFWIAFWCGGLGGVALITVFYSFVDIRNTSTLLNIFIGAVIGTITTQTAWAIERRWYRKQVDRGYGMYE